MYFSFLEKNLSATQTIFSSIVIGTISLLGKGKFCFSISSIVKPTPIWRSQKRAYSENPDFSIRRVGFYAGKIYTDINKNEQSHYFLKLSPTVSKIQFIKYYDSLIFESNNTVGSKSISKQEFISLLNLFNT